MRTLNCEFPLSPWRERLKPGEIVIAVAARELTGARSPYPLAVKSPVALALPWNASQKGEREIRIRGGNRVLSEENVASGLGRYFRAWGGGAEYWFAAGEQRVVLPRPFPVGQVCKQRLRAAGILPDEAVIEHDGKVGIGRMLRQTGGDQFEDLLCFHATVPEGVGIIRTIASINDPTDLAENRFLSVSFVGIARGRLTAIGILSDQAIGLFID